MDWIRGEELGHGSFAKVNLAVVKNQSPFLPPLMAVKSCGVSHSASLTNEKLILDQLKKCSHVIDTFGENFSYENGEKIYNVLLEYAPGGDLANKLKNSGDRRLPEIEVRKYTKTLLRGLNYIHKAGYVHCDLKLQNILLCQNGAVKIADFGLSKRSGQNDGVSRCELRGTPLYMSPEMVINGEQETASDIWALGCAVAEMAGGSPPWRFSDVAALLMRIGAGEELPAVPGVLSDEGKDFVQRCFVRDPRERWTAEMLLNHPFVSGQDFDDNTNVTTLKDEQASSSPKCPFDFPDWESRSITSLPSPGYSPESGIWFSDESNSPAERLRGLVSGQGPDWSVTEHWVTVR